MKFSASVLLVIMALVLAACNLPAAQATQGSTVEQQAATLVAATLNAQPTLKPTTAVTPTATSSLPTSTATAKPTLKINADGTECRRGPDANAALVATFDAGVTVDLVGKDNVNSFWVVVDPTSHNLCWVQGAEGTPGGSYQTVAEVTPPPSSTSNAPKAPARPAFVRYAFQCSFGSGGTEVKVDLSWPDAADNETGYYVYRDGSQIADLPANSTSYSDTTSAASGHIFVYGVAAHNDSGTSDQALTQGGDSIACQ
jgi:hypothetical protein